jgi:glycosyltransferase involved in cell wall biosynthesis
MKISAVIPTKNRAQDLFLALKSILLQTELPDQLIIIDQSDNKASFNIITKLDLKNNIDLTYILDPKIKGLVHAKHVSLDYVKNELVSFLEEKCPCREKIMF